MTHLEHLGWSPFFDNQLTSNDRAQYVIARVCEERRGSYSLLSDSGFSLAELSGKLRHQAAARTELPAVGDWVLCTLHPSAGPGELRAIIHRVLERRSLLRRRAAGTSFGEQILAANVDTTLIASSLNADFNPRRLERYLALCWESGSSPAVLLTKADLCEDPEAGRGQVEAIAPFVPIHVVSAAEGRGMDELSGYLLPGKTLVILGSSGVGKSTLVNRLLGDEAQEVQSIRSHDDRGKHTTTSRQLLSLPGGAMIIDTPGMRELALWEDDGGVDLAFEEIHALGARCRFNDCAHRSEPGCAVLAAIDQGALDPERLEAYFKLGRELAFAERKRDRGAMSEERKRWKAITVRMRKKRRFEEEL